MVGFGSNWYQMHGWVLAWRWHMVGFGSNCYHTICLSFCNNRQTVRDIDVNAM